jgi:hypothetical protein
MWNSYRIITGDSSTLPKKVETFLKEGWSLYGPPFSTGNRVRAIGVEYVEIAQAVVGEDDTWLKEKKQ